ncbi:hypothetical protein A4H97_24305 [Niastella yeongjuensis]|uniref:Uncharacterized protein n=1 Tax=Niastella yeongjuensis TaxID=354355 RepID=A0A1V9F3M5_9BACT|nr:hypothetical protein [Niastella yeongjuensis]OQP52825.1 hypothetical protein A4H97_24305 [Niastella yeongjuensis]SEP20595.1 hypothetical protein SAMN05660816_04749 [Niastella yeongjuensis]
MAKIKDNLLVRGASGNVGKQFVYRKRGEDTFITRMPSIDENAKPTEKQELVRERFFAAAGYATGAIADPNIKAQYQKRAKAKSGVTAYNVAFRDFLKAPVVKQIDTTKYNGTPGSTIVINATDDFRVIEVAVSIKTAAGVLVEEGNAILNPINRNEWTYAATQNNAALAGSIILATAKDLPGNKGTLEATV